MIEVKRDGTVLLGFRDWSIGMKQLSLALATLPLRHGLHPRQHDLAIDVIGRWHGGEVIIHHLIEHAQELSHRPTDRELLATAKSIVRADMALVRLLQQRHADIKRIGLRRGN
jgi:hypothetical protein